MSFTLDVSSFTLDVSGSPVKYTAIHPKPIGPPNQLVRQGSVLIRYAWKSEEQKRQWPELWKAEQNSKSVGQRLGAFVKVCVDVC